MTEDFLHHIWKFKLFDKSGLMTTTNEPVEIIRAGDHNTDAGPDFFNARLRIGKTMWAGNVEIHIHASDWNRHGHEGDRAYDSIILHVVYNADIELRRPGGEPVPTIEIKSRIPLRQYQRYLDFKSSAAWIPCEKQIGDLPPVILRNTIDKMLLERLARKSAAVLQLLRRNNNDWEEGFYQGLARNFGFHTNGDPFEMLARSLPSALLARHRNSLLQTEAMLFGQAGMLDMHFADSYPRSLQNEYVFLKKKFGLLPLEGHLWKFLRLRPVNFPCIRIAQFAGLMFRTSGLFAVILERNTPGELRSLFVTEVSDYWRHHYTFDKPSAHGAGQLGEHALNNIIVNTIVPFLFTYGKQFNKKHLEERAISLLEALPPESNAITASWERVNLRPASAYEAQALIQLRNEYCLQKKCLNCMVGCYLLKNS